MSQLGRESPSRAHPGNGDFQYVLAVPGWIANGENAATPAFAAGLERSVEFDVLV
jgi:hypothetical protein